MVSTSRTSLYEAGPLLLSGSARLTGTASAEGVQNLSLLVEARLLNLAEWPRLLSISLVAFPLLYDSYVSVRLWVAYETPWSSRSNPAHSHSELAALGRLSQPG